MRFEGDAVVQKTTASPGMPNQEENRMLHKIGTALGLSLGLSLACGNAFADAEAGKAIAGGTCAGCHGAKGSSTADNFPNLAGQKKTYLVNALKAYRDKTRNAAMMNGMAASLTDAQIDDIAAYFSSLKSGE